MRGRPGVISIVIDAAGKLASLHLSIARSSGCSLFGENVLPSDGDVIGRASSHSAG
jgi:hypothetical protein